MDEERPVPSSATATAGSAEAATREEERKTADAESHDGSTPPEEEEEHKQEHTENDGDMNATEEEEQEHPAESTDPQQQQQQENANQEEEGNAQSQGIHESTEEDGGGKEEDGSSGDALVGFRVFPDGLILQPQPFDTMTSIRTLKQAIGEQLQVPWLHVVIRFGGVLAPTWSTLYDCGVFPATTILGDITIDSAQESEEYVMPKEIMVQIQDGE